MDYPETQSFTATFIDAYDTLADPIFRFCLFYVRDRERARDLMQETFTRTWSYLVTGKTIKSMRPFLYKTARNLCMNEVSRKAPASLEEMHDAYGFEPASAEDSPVEQAERAQLLSAVAALDPDIREVITLRYIEGMAVHEIAETLGIRPNAASVRIHRAIRTLREKMGETTTL